MRWMQVLENSTVPVEKITMECQYLDRSASLWLIRANVPVPNDCEAIRRYVQLQYPLATVEEHMTNCFAAEYHLTIVTQPHVPPGPPMSERFERMQEDFEKHTGWSGILTSNSALLMVGGTLLVGLLCLRRC